MSVPYDWTTGAPRNCVLPLGHKGLCSGAPAAAPVEPEDGGEALRREVERLCNESEAATEEYVEAQGDEYNGVAWVSIEALRAALSAAAAAVRERR